MSVKKQANKVPELQFHTTGRLTPRYIIWLVAILRNLENLLIAIWVSESSLCTFLSPKICQAAGGTATSTGLFCWVEWTLRARGRSLAHPTESKSKTISFELLLVFVQQCWRQHSTRGDSRFYFVSAALYAVCLQLAARNNFTNFNDPLKMSDVKPEILSTLAQPWVA